MAVPKKISILSGLFLVLAVVALWILIKGKPTTDDTMPLQSVEESKIVKVIVREPAKTVALEKRAGEWWITEPMEDWAATDAVDQLIGSLRSFSVGSVISDKEDRYPTFNIDDVNATQVQVYRQGSESPVLDIYLGKQAVSYTSSYLRYAGKTSVYIADNLPGWVLMKSPSEYRQQRIIPVNKDEIEKLDIKSGQTHLLMVRSSDTWTREGSTTPLEGAAVSKLLASLDEWRADDFLDQLDPSVKTELDKPFLVAEAFTPAVSRKAIVGKKLGTAKGQPDPQQRYIQTEGRTPVMLISASHVDDVAALLSELTK